MGTLIRNATVEAHSDAAPDDVWALVADVRRTGEWSHETVGAEWLDGATAVTPGARFRGRNEQGRARWSRTCEVVDAEPGRRLRFRTIPTWLYRDSSMWTFELDEVEGGTRITQRFEVLQLNPVLERVFHACLPAHRDRRAALREDVERLGALAAGVVPHRRTDVR